MTTELNAALDALEIDVEIKRTEMPESRAFNQRMEKDGIRAAIKWRCCQFN